MEAPVSTPQQSQEVPLSKPSNPKEDSAASAASAASAGAATVAEVNEDGKKRKFDHDGFRSSKYFKICSIVKELRPFFVEVSRTPNFKDSKAVHEIQIRMKTLAELTKQLRSETPSITKCHETPAKEPLSAVAKEESVEKQQKEGKQASQPQPDDDPAASVDAMDNGIREKKEELEELLNFDEGQFVGPFLVGGSPIGWNFLIYPGRKPVFYGVSKESKLAQLATTE